jgi:hypothetical protein
MKMRIAYTFRDCRLGFNSTIYATDDGKWWTIRIVRGGVISREMCDTLEDAFLFAGIVSSITEEPEDAQRTPAIVARDCIE